MEGLSREEIQAMDGFCIGKALLSLLATVGEIADQAETLTRELAAAETVFVFAEGKEDKQKAKAEVIRLKAEIKCNSIRKNCANRQASVLQTASRTVNA